MTTISRTLLLLLLSPLAVHAATFQVAPSGSDASACGAGPRRTINAGIACLSGGDTLEIGGGTYPECLHNQPGWGSTPIPTGVTLRAKAGEPVWLRPTSVCPADREFGGIVTLWGDSDFRLTLDGINLDGSGGSRVGLEITSKRNTFQNLTVKNIGRGCIINQAADATPGNGSSAGHNTYRNLILDKCGTHPIAELGGPGFYINSWHNTLDGVTVRGATGAGIQLIRDGGGAVQGNVVKNSLLAGNQGQGIAVYPGNLIEGNVICNNYVGIDAWGGALRHNRVFANREVNIQLKGGGHVLEGNTETGSSADCPSGPATAGPVEPPKPQRQAPYHVRIVPAP